MTSLQLLRCIIKNSGTISKPISSTTSEIFQTTYHSNLDMSSFDTLEYPKNACRPKHEKRGEVEVADELEDRISENCADSGNEDDDKKWKSWMLKKFVDNNICDKDEQDRLLNKYKSRSLTTIFFDFESYTNEIEHQAFMCCWKDSKSGDVSHSIGASCAEEFLEAIAQKYGFTDCMSTKKTLPQHVTLIAHNVTYDFSFLFQHLHRLQTIERGTSIISATARFHSKKTNKVVELKFRDSYKMI
eukprot:95255-Pleurochrysis_carterae.AAC.1